MGRTTFKGPVRSQNGFEIGSSGSTLSLVQKGTVAFTISALAAAAEEDLSATITGALAGDVVILTPPNAAMETGVAVIGSWVSAADTVKVRISNVSGSSLTGGANTWSYVLIRS